MYPIICSVYTLHLQRHLKLICQLCPCRGLRPRHGGRETAEGAEVCKADERHEPECLLRCQHRRDGNPHWNHAQHYPERPAGWVWHATKQAATHTPPKNLFHICKFVELDAASLSTDSKPQRDISSGIIPSDFARILFTGCIVAWQHQQVTTPQRMTVQTEQPCRHFKHVSSVSELFFGCEIEHSEAATCVILKPCQVHSAMSQHLSRFSNSISPFFILTQQTLPRKWRRNQLCKLVWLLVPQHDPHARPVMVVAAVHVLGPQVSSEVFSLRTFYCTKTSAL